MRQIDQPTQQMSGHAELAPPAPALATTIPQPEPATTGSAFLMSRGNPAPSSSNREETDTKTTEASPLGGPTPDTTSSIPKEFASQRAGGSLAAPAPNTAPGIGTATDETTSAISDMYQAAPATAVAPDAEILAGATTDEIPAPSSSNREETDTKTTEASPLGGPTPDTTSSIPKEFASQRAGGSLAAPAPNTAPGIGTATDETTSAISDMHQAVPATAVAPDAEILAGATTDETGSPTSDMPQAGSSSELNAQVAARGQTKVLS